MKRLLARLGDAARALWAKEPVIVGTVVPEAVALGALTAHEASLIKSTASVVVAVVAQVGVVLGAFRARAVVKSPAAQQAATAPLPVVPAKS